MSPSKKIISSLNEIIHLSKQLEPIKIVLCSGHFNLIHPGHMRFLQYAKSLASKLCIAVYSDKYLQQKDTQWQPFPQMERANGIASLSDVNHVIILDDVDLPELFQLLKPNFYVMGHEFESQQEPDVQQWIKSAKAVQTKVVFHSGSVHYASSNFLDENFNSPCSRNMEDYKHSCNRQNIALNQLSENIKQFNNTKMLVIGDTIVDQFIACDPIGMSSEAPVLALKEIHSKQFIGGAAIVACHLKSLGAESHFISVTGNDEPADFVQQELTDKGIIHHFYISDERPTTFKIRYMVESQKMLRISRLEEKDIPRELEDKIISQLQAKIPDMDGIIVSDFVYGVITERILNTIRKQASKHKVKIFGDLQCSSQTGSLLKFIDFTLLTPTERETRISLSDKDNGLEKLAMDLLNKTRADNLLITLGSEGFIAYHLNKQGKIQSEHFPALANNPIDVAGAGDAVLSVMSLALSSGLSLMEASAIAGCAASIAVSRVGNTPIQYEELIQFMNQIN
ncbi:MAG: adenylyltransferase/cytidyltransferase family protein [Gammaproteobacteria bacterium]|nr:adenylyltransferase/cytidyltransferase family protein [Gammaproteobacteria bacterium]